MENFLSSGVSFFLFYRFFYCIFSGSCSIPSLSDPLARPARSLRLARSLARPEPDKSVQGAEPRTYAIRERSRRVVGTARNKYGAGSSFGVKMEKVNFIQNQILESSDFAQIIKRLKRDKSLKLAISENLQAKAFLIKTLAKKYPTVLVVKDSAELYKFLQAFDIFKTKPDFLELKNKKDFLGILDNFSNTKKDKILILPIEILAERFISPKIFNSKILKLLKDQKISPRVLTKELLDLGYKKEQKVILKGDFAQRGNVFDIFGENAKNPIRIEFFENCLEQIFEYDLFSGEKIKDLRKVKIIPKYLAKNNGLILDWFKNGDLVIFNEPVDLKEKLKDLAILEEKILSWDEIENKLKTLRLDFELLPENARETIKFNFRDCENFQKNLNRFSQRLKDLQNSNYKIFIFSKRKKQLLEFFKSRDIFGVEFLPPGFVTGFYLPNQKIAIFTDLEIIGPEKEIKIRRIKKEEREFLQSLRPGDLVVHSDHGVGRFLKLDFLPAEKKIRYLYLGYKDGDRLYVPENQVSKLTRYIGVSARKSALSKLGSGVWEKTIDAAKEHVQKLARELLSLYSLRKIKKGFSFQANLEWERQLESSFAYQETPDQAETIEKVYQDMEKSEPADRLIAGDVGFGKTEVAIRAALRAVSSGKQVAILAPTTVLVEQHLVTFCQRLSQFPVQIESLSRFKTKPKQRAILEKLAKGKIDIIIGTHRLLQKDVEFLDLGLAIIDEEQRFGVKHKERLKRIRAEVDVLTMTATPIPRTLQMAMTGIKKISTISTPPVGRKPTEIRVSYYDPKLIREYIQRELARKGQVYYLTNKVRTIQAKAEFLRKLIGSQAKIAIAHGQMPEGKLAQTMADFTAGKFDILVCSTIIENGLDLANVNTIIVEEAQDFGLAQLYQLKGRVGRGERQAFGLFLVPKGIKLDIKTRKRLAAFLEAVELGSGLQIAERDLEIRGGGNILGREQSGQIAGVGLALYSQLLEQAVERMKAKN